MKLNQTCWHAGPDGCEALEGVTKCPEHCTFFITYRDSIDSLMRANRRLRSLPERQQEHISRKYYKGERPWALAKGG